MISTSAPGKLVLLGEYAVLEGAPALVAAVNRRARVGLAARDGKTHLVSAPGLFEEQISIDPDGPSTWKEQLPLLARAFEYAPDFGKGTFDILLDTRDFYIRGKDGPIKLGLGSSAALTTALLAAVTALGPGSHPTPPSMEELLRFHRSLQGGAGSGIDLAASLHGGILGYELDPRSDRPRIHATHWPEELHLSFIWSGRPARTTEYLALLKEALETKTRRTREKLARLAGLSAAGLDALESRQIERLPGIIDEFSVGMEELGNLIGKAILSEEHLRLRRLAREQGLAYKPSGAGGGDFGMALSFSRHAIESFESRARALGYATPKLEVEARGLEISQLPKS